MGSGIFVEGLCKFRTHPGSVQAPTVCELTTVSPDLNKCKTSLGQRRELDVDSGVFFRGLNKHRIQLGSIQGNRCALRSGVGVMHKGRTHLSSKAGSELWAQDCRSVALIWPGVASESERGSAMLADTLNN